MLNLYAEPLLLLVRKSIVAGYAGVFVRILRNESALA
jgi:hypothetical protein